MITARSRNPLARAIAGRILLNAASRPPKFINPYPDFS